MKKLAYIVASVFGSGFFPWASGTFGSFVSFVAIVPVVYLYGIWGVVIMTIGTFVCGWMASAKVLQYTEHDPSLIVIDETTGQTITFLFVTNVLRGSFSCWYLYVLGFILFRLFDITKPLIIGVVDRKVENAFGVMFDDVLAGVFAAVVLWLLSLVLCPVLL